MKWNFSYEKWKVELTIIFKNYKKFNESGQHLEYMDKKLCKIYDKHFFLVVVSLLFDFLLLFKCEMLNWNLCVFFCYLNINFIYFLKSQIKNYYFHQTCFNTVVALWILFVSCFFCVHLFWAWHFSILFNETFKLEFFFHFVAKIV